MHGKNKTGKKSGGESGFTLIEVMLAMAIFSVGFLALASMQITATNGNTNARCLMDAVSVLEDHMEYLKNVPNTQRFMDNDNGGLPHPDLDPAGNPHEIEVSDLDLNQDGATETSRHFNGTLRWWVYANAAGQRDPDDGMPDAPDYPPNAIKIVVEVEWNNLMQNRTLRYTFVRIRDIM